MQLRKLLLFLLARWLRLHITDRDMRCVDGMERMKNLITLLNQFGGEQATERRNLRSSRIRISTTDRQRCITRMCWAYMRLCMTQQMSECFRTLLLDQHTHAAMRCMESWSHRRDLRRLSLLCRRA